MDHSTLDLEWRKRQGGGGRTERDFLDFVINGPSLYDLLKGGDSVGALGWGNPEIEKRQIAWLLLKEQSDLVSGRVPIYICAACGDLDCGAITVKILKTAASFVWSDFGFENNDEGAVTLYENNWSFTFSKTMY